MLAFSAWISAAARCDQNGGDGPSDGSGATTLRMAASNLSNVTGATDSQGRPIGFKPMRELTTNIAPSKGELPPSYPLTATAFQPRAFAPCTFMWEASGLCHKPLYFEDVQLERYGHTGCPLLQPYLSGAQFFGTVLVLPYAMGVEPPCEHIYVLGYERPGSCAPYMIDPIPLSLRGAVFEAGAWVGGVFAFP
jgi:hypothetical protein